MARSTTSRLTAGVVVVLLVLGGFGLRPPSEPSTDLGAESRTDRMSTPQAIAFFADRVQRHPGDALSATTLSELHLARGRETGDVGEYRLAALAAETALVRLPGLGQAHLALAKARYGLHDFDGARASAEAAARLDPALGAEVVVADVAVTTGDLDHAERIYAELDARFDSPSLDARLAHVAELEGDYPTAIDMMTAAASEAAEQGYEGEPAAWFQLRLGDLHLESGRYNTAEHHYRTALRIFPRHPGAEAGLARSLAAQGRFEEAAESYEHAIALQPTPATLLAAARMYEHLGLTDEARRHRATLDLIGTLSGAVVDLAYVHHLVDIGEPLQALELASPIAEGRADAATLDALAWAHHHAGHRSEAEALIARALDTGTARAQILFHAAVIHSTVDVPRTVGLLERALAVSPAFEPRDAAAARALLEELRP